MKDLGLMVGARASHMIRKPVLEIISLGIEKITAFLIKGYADRENDFPEFICSIRMVR